MGKCARFLLIVTWLDVWLGRIEEIHSNKRARIIPQMTTANDLDLFKLERIHGRTGGHSPNYPTDWLVELALPGADQ